MKPWINSFLVLGLYFLLPSISSAGPKEEGRAFGAEQHEKKVEDKSAEINALKQEFSQKPENQSFQSQIDHLSTTFEGNFDGGKKGEDPLKAHFGQKTTEASKHKHSYQPSLGETEALLKQKHAFKVGEEDDLFTKYKTYSEAKIEGEEDLVQAGTPPLPSKKTPQAREVTCRKGVAPQVQSCEKRLVVRAVPQSPLVKIVKATFQARCYNLVDFSINLKTGKIGVSNCENPGPVTISVDNPIGEPDYPEQVTVKLLKHAHTGEDGVEYTANQMAPSYANGFQVSFRAFQPHTGRKKSHTNNKNNVRGGVYQWEFTLPRKPILQETWEGCEDLERKTTEKTCELVELEQKNLGEVRVVSDYPDRVTRAHWLESHTYFCEGGRDIDECETLIQQKCEQIHSKCAIYKGEHCIEYENTFRCGVADYQKSDGLSFSAGKLSFLSGQGQSSTEAYSEVDFSEAITGFSALTEMGKDREDGLGGIVGDPSNPNIFRGKPSQCRVNLGSFFRDCCQLKGVLKGLLGGCNEEEKKLAVADVKHKRCVKVEGRYCHKKVAKVCVEKRDSYCCYGSQLARILQEIAHQQLNLPWGESKAPNCGPLTAAQLSNLNFDTPYAEQKLSEIVGEVQAGAKEKFSRVQEAVARFKNLQTKTQEWEKEQTERQKTIKRQTEKQLSPVKGVHQ